MTGLDISSMNTTELMDREWLAVNHLGGYASSSIVGLNTRKYHGLLVAALSPPVRRMVILSRVEDAILWRGRADALSCCEYPGAIHPDGRAFLRAFTAHPFPRWAYQGENWTIDKSVRLVDGQNTVVLTYTLLAGGDAESPIELEVKPLFALRPIHQLMYQWQGKLDAQPKDTSGAQLRIPPTPLTPEAFFAHDGEFRSQANWYLSTIYRRESERGYKGLEDLWMPGPVRFKLRPGMSVHFVCSTDPIDLPRAIASATATYAASALASGNDESLDLLTQAADQFLATTPDRSACAQAGFHWAAPSGRDAMIALPGLLLVTRRFAPARSLVLLFASHLRRGLIPSEFPEDGSPPIYDSADASLWFINAAYAYWKANSDDEFASQHLLEPILAIIRAYREGTSLGISCDEDGILASRAQGIGTSWMNAKIDDGPVTQRAGRPVELNALWHNALCIAASMCVHFGRSAEGNALAQFAESIKSAFNDRFWNPDARCCFDVLPDRGLPDPSIRPNQLFAISLPFPVLAPERNISVLEKVRNELLTPMGVRTLAPDDPSYRARYAGDVIGRDRAYHNGCAYPWLLGPLVTALMRTHGKGHSTRRQAREMLAGPLEYLQGAGMGQLPELFDGDPPSGPHKPGGLIASVRSVAEILRCYVEDVAEPPITPLPDPRRAVV